MRPTLKRIITNKGLLVALGLLALYALAGFVLAPRVVEHYISTLLEKRLDRSVKLGQVRVNPFLLTLEINDVAVEGMHGRPVLAAEHVFVDLSASGIIERAWTFDQIHIDGLNVHAVIRPNGGMNMADLARQWSRRSTAKSGAAQRMIFQDLLLQDGRVYVSDLSDEQPVNTEIGPIRLQASDVATFADGKGAFELTAKLPEDGALDWRGVLSLDPLTSSGTVQVRKLRAAALWPFMRDELQLATLEGAAQLSMQYVFQAEGSPMLHADQIALDLSHVLMARPDREPMLRLQSVSASGGQFNSADRLLVVPKLNASNGAVRVQVGSDGVLNWQQILDSNSAAREGANNRRWRLHIDALTAEGVGLHYEDQSRAPPLQADISEIAASTQVQVVLGETSKIVISDGDLTLRGISLGGSGDDALLSLGSVHVTDARVDSAAKHIEARALTVNGGDAAIVREPDGDIAPLDRLLLGRADAGAAAAQAPAARAGGWNVGIAAASAQDVALSLTDQTFNPPISYDVVLQSARVENLTTNAKAAMPFKASLVASQGGGLSASGSVAPGARAVNAEVNVDALALPPLQPLVKRFATLSLDSGVLSGQFDINYQSEQTRVQVSGSAAVSDLLLSEVASGDRFLQSKQLVAREFTWRSEAGQLSINEVIATGPQAKIVISKNRQVNVAQIWRPQGGQVAEQTAGAQRHPPRTGNPFQFQISHVRVRGGLIDFADHSLVLPFSTRVTAVNGSITGVTSELSRSAEVRARGTVQPYGSASVEGTIEMFEPTRHTDLQVTFNNVLMPALSPYTATFAGRKIESGRLWLDLDYEIEKGELLGKNEIRIENFSLGDRVPAPNALDLPLDLMIALLKDSSGTIRMSVPVRGDLDQPRFSLGDAVRAALGNVAQKIVSAPFRALAQMFGGNDDESLAEIAFTPGSARIRPEARERLDVLARALTERPQLQLIVTGSYDEDVDKRALRRQRAQRDLAAALGRTVGPGEDPGLIDFSDPATQRQIETVLAGQVGRDAVDALKRKQSADPRAVHRAMFERLVGSYPIADAAAQILAAQRADAIAGHLASARDVDRHRIQTGGIREVDPGQKNLISVELRAAAGDASASETRSAGPAPAPTLAAPNVSTTRTE